MIDGVGIAFTRFLPPGTTGRADRAGSTGRADRAGDRPTVVMMHEGLGSVTQWKDLPAVLARRCGLEVVAYDRGGYGRSDPFPPRYVDGFMTREATAVLPAVTSALGIHRPILVGHSDGASIALIAAALGSVHPLGVATIAPHTFIEQICLDGIRAIDSQRDQVIEGLSRHHDHPRLAFERWRNVWLTEQFRHWDITDLLERIDCKVLVLQGDGDQYGTDAQVWTIEARCGDATGHIIGDCGHVAHRDQPDAVANRLVEFIDECVTSAVSSTSRA